MGSSRTDRAHRAAALLALLLGAAPACGARTDLDGEGGHADADAGAGTIRPDGGADRCAALFQDCDGSEADCAEAFRRGCECGGTPPSYVVSDDAHAARIAWAAGHFLVGDRFPPEAFHVLDATGRERLHTLDALSVLGVDGRRVFLQVSWVGSTDRPAYEVHEVDVPTGRHVGPRRFMPLWWVVPVGGGDVVTAFAAGPDEDNEVGLLRPGEERPAWTTVLPGSSGGAAAAAWSWNGTRLLITSGRRVYLYDPYDNEVTGPITHDGMEDEVFRYPRPYAQPWATEAGWLVAWRERRPHSAIGLRALSADGRARGPIVRHLDPLGLPGQAVFARRPGGPAAFLYARDLRDCTPPPHSVCAEHVMLRVDDDAAPLGPPRRVHAARYLPRIISLLWAGYSYAYTRQILEVDESGEHPRFRRPGVELQRICLDSLP